MIKSNIIDHKIITRKLKNDVQKQQKLFENNSTDFFRTLKINVNILQYNSTNKVLVLQSTLLAFESNK